MFSLEKRQLNGDITLFKYLKGCHRKENQDLFSIISEHEIMGSCYKNIKASYTKTNLTIEPFIKADCEFFVIG